MNGSRGEREGKRERESKHRGRGKEIQVEGGREEKMNTGKDGEVYRGKNKQGKRERGNTERETDRGKKN